MCASLLNYEGEFYEARAKRPLSVVFFYDSNIIRDSDFQERIKPLNRYALSRCMNNLHFFRTNQLTSILPSQFGLYLSQGVLIFRDGNLLDYLEDFSQADFEKAFNAPSTQSCLNVPIDADTRLIKQTIKEERAKGVAVKKVLMSKDRTKLMIYHDDKNITIRPVKRGVDACVGTDSPPPRKGVDACVGTDDMPVKSTGVNASVGTSTAHPQGTGTTINNQYNSSGCCCVL